MFNGSRSWLAAWWLVLGLVVAGCSPQDTPVKPATMASPAQAYEAVAAQGKGFTAGAMMSAHTVYVLFDPQCPHCGRLWQASLPLHNKVKFVWQPVAILNAKSAPQGAALMSAANPTEAMTVHETSLLGGSGGISASANASPEVEAAIKANTALFTSLGAESVPFIVARNVSTGQPVSHAGAMETAALAQLLGL